ncbi:hypothetical protein SEA_SERENITY_68 [Mycobacterium phage Serenity]|nr:hypothetical protein SEA_SERENITY_68 [Mycobacterium phage Serenity]ALF00935.1 hypothetical protein SEA_SERENITY_68 [Mycobacterium phage Serenity]
MGFIVWTELVLHFGYLVGAVNGFYGWFPS